MMMERNEKQEYIDKIVKRHNNFDFKEDAGILISMVWDDARSSLRKNILQYFSMCEEKFEDDFNEAELYKRIVGSLKILLEEKH